MGNGIENRAGGKTMSVNHLYFEIYNKEKEEVTYKNNWMTNLEISEGNVENMTACARARWKIENEHNNILKKHGYNLEHNFGHRQNHVSELFCLLNLLAFLFHGVQRLIDEEYRKAYNSFGRKINFFWTLRCETNRCFHKNWVSLLLTVSAHPPDG
jgi:hypothetical protein